MSGALVLLFFLSGCMGGRTIEIDLGYDKERKPEMPLSEGTKLSIVLIPFDVSADAKDVLGKWVGIRGREDTIKTARALGDSVTGAAFDYLKKIGLEVAIAPAGSRLEDFGESPPDLIVHGIVETFRADAVSELGFTKIKMKSRMKINMKNVKDGSVLTVNIESSSEPKTVVSTSPKVFEETAREVLSESLERMLSNTVLEEGVLRPRK